MMFRPAVHLLAHFIVPGVAAKWAYADRWRNAWIIMVATMIVDLDHLMADPVYDPNRCRIEFHLPHTYPAIGIYLLLLMIPKIRLVGLGLLIHMLLDGIDCMWMLFGVENLFPAFYRFGHVTALTHGGFCISDFTLPPCMFDRVL